jgi:hypothetical protein
MPLTYVSDGAWGTGQGAPLNAPQHDTNIFTLAEGIAALDTALDGVISVENITSSGNIVTFHLSDDTTIDIAFDLPSWVFRGVWTNSTAYQVGDIVTVADLGTFLVLYPHTSPALPAIFDPNAVEELTAGDELLYGMLVPEQDLTGFVEWFGQWSPSTAFAVHDIFTEPTYGLFITLVAHTTAASFDPDAVDDEDNPLYAKMAGPPFAPVEEIADTDYEVTRADTGKYLRFTEDSTAGVEITFADDLDVNTEIHVEQAGDGPLFFTETTTTILPQRDGFDTTTPYKGAVITAKYVAAGIVKLIGPHGDELSA